MVCVREGKKTRLLPSLTHTLRGLKITSYKLVFYDCFVYASIIRVRALARVHGECECMSRAHNTFNR